MEFQSVYNSLMSRRGVLQFGGTAAAAGALSMGSPIENALAASTGGLNFDDPKDNVYAFGKTWGTYADKPVYSAWKGILFASIGTRRMEPLFGYTGFGNLQCKLLDNGHIRLRGKEGNFFTDLSTGEILESWYNPYTEENLEVFIFLNDRVRGELTLDMPIVSHGKEGDKKTLINEATTKVREDGTAPFIMPFERQGSMIHLAWDYRHEYTNPVTQEGWPRASTGPEINPSEHFVFYINRDELEDRSNPTARFYSGFTRLSQFWPWMKMGGTEFADGKMMGRSHSFKEDTEGMSNIPPKLLAYLEKNHPDYLEPCDDWDDGKPKETWAAYAEQVPPENPNYEWTPGPK